MSQQIPIAEARNNLSKLVRAVEQGQPIEITRCGRPVAVLVSVSDYNRLCDRPRTGFVAAVNEVRARYGLSDMVDATAALFPRDASPGRDVELSL